MSGDDDVQTVECMNCYDDVPPSHMIRLSPGCEHELCVGCTLSMIRMRLGDTSFFAAAGMKCVLADMPCECCVTHADLERAMPAMEAASAAMAAAASTAGGAPPPPPPPPQPLRAEERMRFEERILSSVRGALFDAVDAALRSGAVGAPGPELVAFLTSTAGIAAAAAAAVGSDPAAVRARMSHLAETEGVGAAELLAGMWALRVGELRQEMLDALKNAIRAGRGGQEQEGAAAAAAAAAGGGGGGAGAAPRGVREERDVAAFFASRYHPSLLARVVMVAVGSGNGNAAAAAAADEVQAAVAVEQGTKRLWAEAKREADKADGMTDTQLRVAKLRRQHSEGTATFLATTTKSCPGCSNLVTHYHGHACHHISPGQCGKKGCRANWCYACEAQCTGHSCRNCNLFCTGTGILLFLEADPTGCAYPKDSRCSCQICPTCRPGSPCGQCSGDCVVCRGLVPPGPQSLEPAELRRFLDSPLLKAAELTRSAEERKLKEMEARFRSIPVLRLPREERFYTSACIRRILDGAEYLDLRADDALGRPSLSAGAMELVAMVLGGSAVKRLFLGGNALGCDGCAALAAVLPQCAKLAALEMRFNGIGDRGAAALAGSLPDSAVADLDLQGNLITDEGAAALGAAVGRSQVSALHMSGNTSITAAGDKAIAEGMGSATASQTIADLDAEEVSLSSTSLATAQVVGIAAMLSQSRVHTLSLTYADVDDVGATALADALRVSPQLTSLSLHGNNITDVGANAIASALGASNVTSLALTSNNMTNEGAWAVLDALEGAEVDEDEDEDE